MTGTSRRKVVSWMAATSAVPLLVAGRESLSKQQVVLTNDIPVIPGPDIAAFGDSLTNGSGGGGTSYPSALSDLLAQDGYPGKVRKLAVGGEASVSIAARAGGRPALVTVPSGAIPASGPVTVALRGDNAEVKLLIQGSAGVNPVQIAAVEGTLTRSATGEFSFTRSETGTPTPVPYEVPLITDAARSRRSDLLLMWWGQNDHSNDASAIIARQRAQIEFQNSLDKRYLVLGLSSGTAEFRAPMEAQFLDAYGRRFINVRAYLTSQAALDAEGITATSLDLADQSTGSTQRSLRADAVHLNGAGYRRVAWLVFTRLKELGWA